MENGRKKDLDKGLHKALVVLHTASGVDKYTIKPLLAR